MATYSISKTFEWRGAVTDKVASVCRMFGLSLDNLIERSFTHSCRLEIDAGDIVYLTGPSGAGKSVLLAELQKAVHDEDRINLAEISLPVDRTLIDCIDAEQVQQKLERLGDCDARFIEQQVQHFLKSHGRRRDMPHGLERTRYILTKLTARPVYYIWFNPKLTKEDK